MIGPWTEVPELVEEELSEKLLASLTDGEDALSEGEFESILQYFDNRLRSNPINPVLWNNKAVVLDRMGRHEDALESYDQAIQVHRQYYAALPPEQQAETEPEYSVAYYNKGNTLCFLDLIEDAIGSYHKGLSIKADDEGLLIDITQTLLQTNHEKEALKLFDHAIENDPKNGKIHFCRGLVLETMGKIKKALVSYRKAVELAPDFGQARISLGNTLFALGNYEEAFEGYDKALLEIEHDEEMWNNMGYILFSMGRYEEAIRYYDKAIEINPFYKPAWYNKGYTLQTMNMLEDAIICYDEAIKLDPNDEILWNNRGNAEYNLRRYETSTGFYEEALELVPDYDIALNNIGNALMRMGKWEESIEWHDKALEINKKFDYAWYAKGQSLHKIGKHEEGLKLIDKSLELNPNYDHTWLAKADTLRALGRDDEAMECLDKAIELNPDFREAWAEKADMLDDMGRDEEAAECQEEALRSFDVERLVFPRDPVIPTEKGEYLLRLLRPDDALTIFKFVLEDGPKQVKARLGMAKALSDLGRHAESISAYRDALRMTPKDPKIWLSLGRAYLDADDPKGADKAVSGVLKLDPGSIDAHLEHARIRSAMGDGPAALEALDKAVGLDGMEQEQRIEALLLRSNVLRALGRSDEAKVASKEALDLDPRNELAWCEHGMCFYNLKEYKGAIHSFDGALGIDATYELAWFGKALCLSALGQVGKAKKYVEMALEMNPDWDDAKALRTELEKRV